MTHQRNPAAAARTRTRTRTRPRPLVGGMGALSAVLAAALAVAAGCVTEESVTFTDKDCAGYGCISGSGSSSSSSSGLCEPRCDAAAVSDPLGGVDDSLPSAACGAGKLLGRGDWRKSKPL